MPKKTIVDGSCFKPIDFKTISLLLESSNHSRVEIHLSSDDCGFIFFVGDLRYKLYTQRNTERRFKTPQSALKFLAGLGFSKAEIVNLGTIKYS